MRYSAGNMWTDKYYSIVFYRSLINFADARLFTSISKTMSLIKNSYDLRDAIIVLRIGQKSVISDICLWRYHAEWWRRSVFRDSLASEIESNYNAPLEM